MILIRWGRSPFCPETFPIVLAPGAVPRQVCRGRSRPEMETFPICRAEIAGEPKKQYLCTEPWWWNGRHEGLKIPWPETAVRVRVPPGALQESRLLITAGSFFQASAYFFGFLGERSMCTRTLPMSATPSSFPSTWSNPPAHKSRRSPGGGRLFFYCGGMLAGTGKKV